MSSPDPIAIERVQNPTRDTFEQDYIPALKPIVIEGALGDWKAFSTWSLDYLRDRVGHKLVRAAYSPTGTYEKASPREMTLGQYLDIIESQSEERGKYYVAGLPVDKFLPELKDTYQVPAILDPGEAEGLALFLGRDSTTGCHFHPYRHNVLIQVVGQKRVRLYGPEDFSNLYPKSTLAAHWNWSRIDFGQPIDFERFPKMRRAQPYECLLQPGDMLFIPIHWWHAVYGEQLSISGAIFWHAPRKHWNFLSPGMRCAVKKVIINNPRLKSLIPAFIKDQ